MRPNEIIIRLQRKYRTKPFYKTQLQDMRNLIRLFSLLIISGGLIGGVTSCSDGDDCSIAGRDMVNSIVYTINPETNQVEKDTIYSLTVTALGTDSIIVNNQTNVQTLSLPLAYALDSTVLVFHYDYATDPANSDTIYIKQNNVPFFESMECGYSMIQTITGIRYTKHQIDSIYIRNINANTDGTENLKLFYRYRY